MTPPTDLTTTQKIYMPLSKLHQGQQRQLTVMSQAYGRGDFKAMMKALHYIELIDKKLSGAAQRVREYALSKARHDSDGGGRSLGMKSE